MSVIFPLYSPSPPDTDGQTTTLCACHSCSEEGSAPFVFPHFVREEKTDTGSHKHRLAPVPLRLLRPHRTLRPCHFPHQISCISPACTPPSSPSLCPVNAALSFLSHTTALHHHRVILCPCPFFSFTLRSYKLPILWSWKYLYIYSISAQLPSRQAALCIFHPWGWMTYIPSLAPCGHSSPLLHSILLLSRWPQAAAWVWQPG